MFKIFGDKLCGGDCFRFENGRSCEHYSIWQFSVRNHWQNLKQLLLNPENISLCRPEWFPLIFWLSLFLSVGGVFYSAQEFFKIYFKHWEIKEDKKNGHQYYVISWVFRRNARLISSAVMVKSWSGLLFGISTVTPSAISSWIAIYSVTVFLDLILWIGVNLFVKMKLDFRSCCKHLVPIGTLLMVRCVHGVFVREIERRANIDELKLIASFAKMYYY